MLLRPSALIIEDDAYALRLIGAVAERAGFNVTTAITGADAVTAADSLPFDIIVVDLNLPDVDGLALIEQLRDRPQLEEVPFIVCSGNVSVDTVTNAGRLGAIGFMRKPIDLQEMQRRLERSYDLLPVRWNAPTAHRTFEQRQSASEALARAKRYIAQVIELSDPSAPAGESESTSGPHDESPAVVAPGAAATLVAPVALAEADPHAADEDDENDAPEVLTVPDLLATLRIDAATIGAPRLERLVVELSGDSVLAERRALLITALRVALKSLNNRLEA